MLVPRPFVAILLLTALYLPPLSTEATLPRQRARPAAPREQIVGLVNRQRTAAGLRSVRANAILMAEAQRFSGVQARLGRLTHRGDDGTTAGRRLTRAGYRWSFYGENLAAGQATPERVVAMWMASPGHRAIILHPRAREVGVGHTFRDNDPNRFFDYWVLELARPR